MGDVLKNPHRRKILEILSTRKAATPKEISGELKIGVPTVYYHLELMKGYVLKTARGEFAATERGLALQDHAEGGHLAEVADGAGHPTASSCGYRRPEVPAPERRH